MVSHADGGAVEAVAYVCARVIRGSMHWGAQVTVWSVYTWLDRHRHPTFNPRGAHTQYSIVSRALPPPDRHLAALLNAARHWGLDRAYQVF